MGAAVVALAALAGLTACAAPAASAPPVSGATTSSTAPALSGTPCHVPEAIADGWTPVAPETAGFDRAALCAALDEMQRGPDNLHAVVIARNGQLVAEAYRDGVDHPIDRLYGLPVPFSGTAHFDARTRHDVRSISKSVVSLLVGIAQSRGALGEGQAIDQPVARFLPEVASMESGKSSAAITLRHLLTMSSGLEWDEAALPNDETRLFWTGDIARFVLDRPQVGPAGQRFHYNSGGTAVLAEVLKREQGASLSALVQEQLFGPLGIEDWVWAKDLRGRELAFTGLRMRPRDLARLGQLVLQQGRWEGRQLVPAEWIAASTAPHIDSGLRLPPDAPQAFGYGYQWWTGSLPGGARWSAAFGNGGQRLYVVPALSLVVVIHSGDYGDARINSTVQRLFERIAQSVRDPSGAGR